MMLVRSNSPHLLEITFLTVYFVGLGNSIIMQEAQSLKDLLQAHQQHRSLLR